MLGRCSKRIWSKLYQWQVAGCAAYPRRGAAVLAAAPRVPDAAAVVTIGAPASAAHVTHNFAANLTEIVEKGPAEVTLAGRTFTITK